MGGRKIKLYHKGIQKQCPNCFKVGHKKKECTNERREWLDYVDGYMINSNLGNELFGNWVKQVEDWRLRNPEKHEQNLELRKQAEERKASEKEERSAVIAEISTLLADQRLASKQSATSEKQHQEEESLENIDEWSPSKKKNMKGKKSRKERKMMASQATEDLSVADLERILQQKKDGGIRTRSHHP
jgi:hypothetical protein